MCLPQAHAMSSSQEVAPRQWAGRIDQSAVGHCLTWAATELEANSKHVTKDVIQCNVFQSDLKVVICQLTYNTMGLSY